MIVVQGVSSIAYAVALWLARRGASVIVETVGEPLPYCFRSKNPLRFYTAIAGLTPSGYTRCLRHGVVPEGRLVHYYRRVLVENGVPIVNEGVQFDAMIVRIGWCHRLPPDVKLSAHRSVVCGSDDLYCCKPRVEPAPGCSESSVMLPDTDGVVIVEDEHIYCVLHDISDLGALVEDMGSALTRFTIALKGSDPRSVAIPGV